jgi:hypothetical protein
LFGFGKRPNTGGLLNVWNTNPVRLDETATNLHQIAGKFVTLFRIDGLEGGATIQ